MKKALVKKEQGIWYFVDGTRIEGSHSRLYGNVSGISGDVSGIYGDVSRLSGTVSGIYGTVSGIYGNVSDCEISDAERKAGVFINDLIGQ